jgi:O-antigen/teichoic acid export membrane protein
MSFLEKLKKGALWSFIARIIGSFSGFIITVLLARLLSIEALAAYYIFLVTLRFGSLLIKVGLDIGLQKVLGIATNNANWEEKDAYSCSALKIITVTSLIFAAILFFAWQPFAFGQLHSLKLSEVTGVIIFAVIFRALEDLGSAYFRGVHEARLGVFLLDVPRQLLLMTALGLIFFLHGNVSFKEVVSIYLVASVVSVLLIIAFFQNWNRLHATTKLISTEKIKAASSRALLILSLPMMVQGIAAILLSTTDIWVLGLFASKDDVAIYGTVARLTTLLTLALGVINMVIPPMLATLYKNGNITGLEQLMRTAASWSSLIVVPILLALFLWGDSVLAILFGEQFREGYQILVILSSAAAFNALSGSPGMLLQMAGYHHQLMALTIFWAVLNVVANIIAVKYFSVIGVSVATAFAIIGQNICAIYMARAKIGVRTWAKLPSKYLIIGMEK